jgi:uncharacterized protein YbjT (DUF2867 family)
MQRVRTLEASITMTVLISGATGNVGGHVLTALLERGVPVRATSRDPQTAALPAGVEVLKADLTDLDSLRGALDGVERVFLYPRFREPEALTTVLQKAGVSHVVLMSASAAANEGTEFDGGGPMRWFERTIAASGLTYTFLRPDTFAGNALFWRDTIRAESAVALPYPDSVQAPIHERDIADVAVVALTTDRLDGAAPVLTGPAAITMGEQVAAIGRALGREITVREQTDEEARAHFRGFLPPHLADAILNAWRDSVGVPPNVSPEVERITGRPGRTFAQWALDHVADYR